MTRTARRKVSGYGGAVRIERVTCHRQLQPLADGPYVMSGGSVELGFDSLVVGLHTDAGLVGWGEMSPLETTDDPVFADGAFAAAPLLADALLGGADGEGTVLYHSIGRADPDELAARAAECRRRGDRRLQVKVGSDPGAADARTFLAATTDLAYTLEQSCATFDECRALRAQAHRPFVLDECIEHVADAVLAAQAGFDGITIKIARVGGVTPARLIRDLAVGFGMSVTVEDTGGADIDTAAMAHLSLTTPAANRAHTVDFHHWVTASNGLGLPPTDDGLLRPPAGAGLGIDVDVAALGEPVAGVSR